MPIYYNNVLTYEAFDYEHFKEKRQYELFAIQMLSYPSCNHITALVKANDGKWYFYNDMSAGPQEVSEDEVNQIGCQKKDYQGCAAQTYFYRIKKDQLFSFKEPSSTLKKSLQQNTIKNVTQLLSTLKKKLLQLLKVVMSLRARN